MRYARSRRSDRVGRARSACIVTLVSSSHSATGTTMLPARDALVSIEGRQHDDRWVIELADPGRDREPAPRQDGDAADGAVHGGDDAAAAFSVEDLDGRAADHHL